MEIIERYINFFRIPGQFSKRGVAPCRLLLFPFHVNGRIGFEADPRAGHQGKGGLIDRF